MIKVKNLVKIYKSYKKKGFFRKETREIVALNKISFKIKKGERVALIGPNGAGKTTTIKILTGILYPTEGEVKVLNYIPWKDRIKLSYKIGVIFTSSFFFWGLSVKDNLDIIKELYNISDKEFKEKIEFFSSYFNIKKLLSRKPSQLSTGERRKIELMSALLHNPKILFLDEPTLGLDFVSKFNFRNLVNKICKKLRVSLLITSHDIGDIEMLTKRAIIINEGKIVYDGSLRKLKKYYAKEKEVIFYMKRAKIPKILKDYKCEIKGNAVKVKVERNKIKEVINEVLSKYKVEDIDIKESSLEEIIRDIYRGKI